MNFGDDNQKRGPLDPDCLKCEHYTVTWDPRWPHACNAMGFRSQVLPSKEVRIADGQSCLAFTSKWGKVKDSPKRSLFRGKHLDAEC